MDGDAPYMIISSYIILPVLSFRNNSCTT